MSSDFTGYHLLQVFGCLDFVEEYSSEPVSLHRTLMLLRLLLSSKKKVCGKSGRGVTSHSKALGRRTRSKGRRSSRSESWRRRRVENKDQLHRDRWLWTKLEFKILLFFKPFIYTFVWNVRQKECCIFTWTGGLLFTKKPAAGNKIVLWWATGSTFNLRLFQLSIHTFLKN